MEIEENLKYSLFLEIYGNLLTDKQKKIASDFLDNNISISEIAINYGSTRQAINDLLKRTFNNLVEYEKKLGLLNKFNFVKEKLNYLKENYTLKSIDENSFNKIVNQILEVL